MDHEKLGYQVSLMMCIRLSPGVSRQKIEEELSKLDDMCCLHSVTGDVDISVLARARDQDHSAKIIDSVRSIKGIDRVDSHLVLRSMTMCGTCGCDCGWEPNKEAK
jgi:DNA-binding Lrp family transcriptional regulator